MKEKSERLLWKFLKKFLAKCEDEEQVFKVFTIVLYGMVIFPKVSKHIEATVTNLVEQVEHRVNHVLAIVAKNHSFFDFYWKKK